MAAIESGTLSNIKQFFSKISNAVVSGVDKLISWGVKISELDQSEEGQYSYTMETPSGNKINIQYVPVVNTDDTWNVTVKAVDSGRTQKYTMVKDTDLADAIIKAVKKLFNEDMSQHDVDSSNRMTVTLKKVCASTGDTINLTSVTANYNATQVLDDLDAVVSDDSFVETLTEEPSSFEIVDTGDAFNVTPITDTVCIDNENVAHSCIELLRAAFALYQNAQFIHWNAKGINFELLHNYTNDLYYTINWQIDTMAEWCVEYCGYAMHPAKFISCDNILENIDGFTAEVGLQYLRGAIDEYIAALELYYCNFDKDIQAVLDGWIRDWKSKAHYKLQRTLLV